MLPTIQEYIDSFRQPSDYFKTLQVQSLPSKFDPNEPYFIAGGFACVFKVKQDNQFWAFKCFLQEDKHRNERLKILSEFLQQRTENYFLKTHYYTNELWVCSQLAGDAEYPTLAMPWIEGLTLGEYVHKAAKERNTDAKERNTDALQTIYDEFLQLAHFLLTNDFAHGDLKHDNILVTQDQNLILIDYDGMYLPELAHISSQELGGHAYQHPKRTAQDWGKHIDDFSILIILLSLRAFIVLPSLIKNHHTENLLLTDKDLQNPMQSQTLQLLWQQNDEPLKHLLGMLLNSLSQNNLRVLEIFGFVERNKPHKFFHWKWWNGLEDKWKRSLRENVEGNEYEVDFFEKICNLKILNLSYTDIKELPNWIGNLINLTELYISENKLQRLLESIGNLTNLTKLVLDHNPLTELPNSIGNLINLTTLNLQNNQLTELPNWIGNLTNLTKLNLCHNHLTELPKSIGNLTKLTELNLEQNQLTELPNWIGNLINLTYLDLGTVLYFRKNRFIELPENIGNLINLTELRAECIHLTRLPNNIRNLANLTKLYLDSNQLTELSESIGNLTNLICLDLKKNQLTSLPESIGNLTNLKSLNLAENQLTSLPKSIGNLTILRFLYLKNNPISEEEKEKIKNLLPNCEIIYDEYRDRSDFFNYYR